MFCLYVKYFCLNHYIRSENGLSKRINWWQFLVVVTDCCCCCSDDWLRVVKSRSRNWKISIWFFVLGVTQNQERRGSPESNVDQEDHGAWLERSHWLRLNIIKHVTRESGEHRFYLISGLRSWLVFPNNKAGRNLQWFLFKKCCSFKLHKDAVWFRLQTCIQPLRYML